jgi:hypothetical protein
MPGNGGTGPDHDEKDDLRRAGEARRPVAKLR